MSEFGKINVKSLEVLFLIEDVEYNRNNQLVDQFGNGGGICVCSVRYWSRVCSICDWGGVGSISYWRSMGSVCYRGSDLGYGSSICEWGGVSGICEWGRVGSIGCWSSVGSVGNWGSNLGNWCSISYWGGNLGNDRGSFGDDGRGCEGFFTYHSVESIDGISSVVHGTTGTIGQQAHQICPIPRPLKNMPCGSIKRIPCTISPFLDSIWLLLSPTNPPIPPHRLVVAQDDRYGYYWYHAPLLGQQMFQYHKFSKKYPTTARLL
nr:unnamed protein product [Callosobruchus analis]